jgi:thiamine biosynthesis protein ThiS
MKLNSYSLILQFNGHTFILDIYKICTLFDIVKFFGYKKNLIVVEYNGEICNFTKWPLINLKVNDQIEIVTIVGGG